MEKKQGKRMESREEAGREEQSPGDKEQNGEEAAPSHSLRLLFSFSSSAGGAMFDTRLSSCLSLPLLCLCWVIEGFVLVFKRVSLLQPPKARRSTS